MQKEKLSILDVFPLENLNSYKPKIKKKNFLELIQDTKYNIQSFFDNIYNFLKSIKIGIENIYIFFPTIWNNRYWDFEFTLKLLIKQLEYQRDGLKKENIIEDIDKIVSQINTTLSNINDWENYDEIFESKQQKLLKQIKDEQDPYQKDYLIGTYYTKLHKFESICWNKIFDSMKQNMGTWWS